jgi:hypothetical protein
VVSAWNCDELSALSWEEVKAETCEVKKAAMLVVVRYEIVAVVA